MVHRRRRQQSVQTKWKVLASALLSLLSGIKREMSQPGLSLHANLRPLQSAQCCRNQGVYCKHESKTNNGNQSQTSGPQMKSEAVSKSIYGQGIPDMRVAMRCKIPPPPSMSILFFGSDYVTQMPSSFFYLSLLLLRLTLHSPFPSDGGIWRRVGNAIEDECRIRPAYGMVWPSHLMSHNPFSLSVRQNVIRVARSSSSAFL